MHFRCGKTLTGMLALIMLIVDGHADPLAKPGDLLLRHDIRLLVDEGVIDIPMNTWPIPWGDILDQLNRAPTGQPSPDVADAMSRLRERARWELDTSGWYLTGWASAAAEPLRTAE